MEKSDLLIGFLLGLISSFVAIFVYLNFFRNTPQVYVVNFSKLKEDGFTKKDLLEVINPNIVLIDRRCVLNPYGRDITIEIEKVLRERKERK